MPSMTRSWISFHFSLATGTVASRWRMTRARLNGTPAASRLDSRRVKFSSVRALIFPLLRDPSCQNDTGASF